jgi:GNAT superfamily N-acetyltransferase
LRFGKEHEAMHVVLQPMTDETFCVYLREHQEEYARDRMIVDGETFEEALRKTRAQHEAELPEGLRTPGHYLFTVWDEERDAEVGYVWFARRAASPDVLWLFHILINEAERRKGYGRLVLAAIEEKAKELGCRVVWLNVMGHNAGAMEFYRACGYRVGAVHMNKFLEAHK